MKVKDYFLWANKNEYTDLQALIMMLCFEKKVLSMEDPQDRLEYFMQDKWHDYTNSHLAKFKQKQNIKEKPYVFTIITQSLGKHRVYVIAKSVKQATSYAFSQGYQVNDIEDMPLDEEWVTENNKGEQVYKPLQQIRDEATEIPSILGAF